MWIFSKFGFLSVSLDDGDMRLISVRGRLFEDVKVAYDRCLAFAVANNLNAPSEIKPTPTRDYDYRFSVAKQVFAGVMVEIVNDINYCKFKPSARDYDRVNNPSIAESRYQAHLAVWGSMLDFGKRVERGVGSSKSVQPTG